MADRFEIKDRIQIVLKYWNTGIQRDLWRCVGGRADQKDGEKDQLVSKRLKGGLTRAQKAEVAQYFADHPATLGLGIQAIELGDALAGSDAAFFAYLASHDPLAERPKAAASSAHPSKGHITGSGEPFEFQLIGAEKDVLQDKLRSAFPILMGTGRPTHERPELKRDMRDLQALYFLYRLGIAPLDRDQFFMHREDGLRFQGKSLGLVLRRVPARFIFRRERTYALEYEEFYEEKIDGQRGVSFRFEANADVYAFENFLTVISRDKTQRTDSRLSLMHLDWRRAQNTNDGFIPGVIAMESDCFPQESDIGPTAYRVLLRRVSDAPGFGGTESAGVAALGDGQREKHWEALKSFSATIRLRDSSRNGIIELDDGREWGEEKDIEGWDATPWAYYFRRLNVIRCPIDVQLAQYTNFRAEGAHAQWAVPRGRPQGSQNSGA